ncbi:MAG: ATP phosphoribosyltransferase [Pseudomonadota bacterium]
MEKTFEWFAERGVQLSRAGRDREYAGTVSGAKGVELVFLSAGEIPRELAAGRIHLGVTGSDLVQEKIVNWQARVEALAHMGFGHADLILAVPDFWEDVVRIEDLDAVSADFRARHGHRLRIATKYHRLVREYLRDQGVANYQLVDSQGATEGTIKQETAEAIADITSTGETLRANHLRVLEDAVIHQSQACLFKSNQSEMTDQEAGDLKELLKTLGL